MNRYSQRLGGGGGGGGGGGAESQTLKQYSTWGRTKLLQALY